MRRTLVLGPAYLDLVVRATGPLLDEGHFDGSVAGIRTSPSPCWEIEDDAGGVLVIRDASSVPGQHIRVAGRLVSAKPPWRREVIGRCDGRFLGGMGAGFAKALDGHLVSAIGNVAGQIDDVGRFVALALDHERISHRPIEVVAHPTDWTLIVTSGPFGDKLAIGFRGCHAAIDAFPTDLSLETWDLLVVAGLSNRLVAEAMKIPARVRMLAPTNRNMLDDEPPLASLAGRFDVLSCNRREWDLVQGQDAILRSTPLVAITDGPNGCRIFSRDADGVPACQTLPAFPRDAPPRDTNRAGEAFAATMIATLLDFGWTPGPCHAGMIGRAGVRASAAAAIVLDREDFGFPAPSEIDHAVRLGSVGRGESLDPR